MAELMERIAKWADLPAEAVAGTVRVSVTGAERVLVENHKGILSYTDTEVEADGRTLRVRIRGQGLLLRAMDGQMLLVTGRISGVDLE